MFVVISILVPNQFVACGDTFILISDTMLYDNVHIKQKTININFFDVLKNQIIRIIIIIEQMKKILQSAVKVAFYA